MKLNLSGTGLEGMDPSRASTILADRADARRRLTEQILRAAGTAAPDEMKRPFRPGGGETGKAGPHGLKPGAARDARHVLAHLRAAGGKPSANDLAMLRGHLERMPLPELQELAKELGTSRHRKPAGRPAAGFSSEQTSSNPDGLGDVEDTGLARQQLAQDIIAQLLAGPDDALFYRPDQARDQRGRWSAMGEAHYTNAREHIRHLQETGGVKAKHAAELSAMLQRLTVQQLHALKAELGLKASGRTKADLAARLHERLRGQPAAKPSAKPAVKKAPVKPAEKPAPKPSPGSVPKTPPGPLLPDQPIGERIAAYREGQAIVADLAARYHAAEKAEVEYYAARNDVTAKSNAYNSLLAREGELLRRGKDQAAAKVAAEGKKAWKDCQAAQKVHDRKLAAMQAAKDAARPKLEDLLRAERSLPWQATNHLTGQHRQDAEKALAFVNATLAHNPSDAPHAGRVQLEAVPAGERDRSYHRYDPYRDDRSLVRIDSAGGADVAVHELGHAIEAHVLGAHAAAQEFLAHRVKDERTTDMASLPGCQTSYDAGERGRKDEFDRYFTGSSAYYVGKDYGGSASEILAMGLQHLYKDAAKFCAKDPEYAAFVIGLMKGHLRSPKSGRPEEVSLL